MKECFGIIYKATNKTNGKSYIGQTTVSLADRKRKHINTALGTSSNVYFYNAIKKYGKKSFIWKIIEYCHTKVELDLAEEWYIKYYKTFTGFENCNGYNLTLGGEGSIGYTHSNVIKKKMSISSFNSDKHVNRGKHLSKEWRKKISLANIGKKLTKEHIEKVRNSKLGKYTGKNSKCAKKFIITTPNNEEFCIIGLSEFSRKYKNGLLDFRLLSAVAYNKRNHHKGYKCRHYNEEIDKGLQIW